MSASSPLPDSSPRPPPAPRRRTRRRRLAPRRLARAGGPPRELLTAGYWTDLVTEAERGLLDFVTIEDALGLQSSHLTEPDSRTDQVRGRLDAVLIAARVAPLTSHIGLVPTAVVTHTEPFHISKAIATLDYVSTGRAGVRVQVSARAHEAAHFGRRTLPPLRIEDLDSPALRELTTDLFDEAADYVEAVRRLWDSWEDDAEIRDVTTGRFVDRDKLHYIDFEGKQFSVKGPRSPPPAAGPADRQRPGPRDRPLPTGGPGRRHRLRHPARRRPGPRHRRGDPRRADGGRPRRRTLHLFGDLVVFLDDAPAAAAARRERLDALAGYPYTSDARIFTGTPAQLADLLQELGEAGLSGFRLRPAVLGHDLPAVTRGLVPELQRRGVFRQSYESDTLRGLLGLSRPANRYAATA